MKVIRVKYNKQELIALLGCLKNLYRLKFDNHKSRCLQCIIKVVVQRIMNKLFREQDSYKLSWQEYEALAFASFYEDGEITGTDPYSDVVLRETYSVLIANT